MGSLQSKNEQFLKAVRMPKTLKLVRRIIGFMQYFAKFIPNLSVKLQPFFKLLRKENDLITTQEHQNSLEILKNSLKEACNLSLKMAKPECQFIIVSDASYYSAGYILLIEDYHDHSLNPNEKSICTSGIRITFILAGSSKAFNFCERNC